MNEHHAKKRPSGCLVVLATGLLGALVGAAVGYVTYDACVPDPNVALDCLFDDPKTDAFIAAIYGLLIGLWAGWVLWALWPRLVRDWRRGGRP